MFSMTNVMEYKRIKEYVARNHLQNLLIVRRGYLSPPAPSPPFSNNPLPLL